MILHCRVSLVPNDKQQQEQRILQIDQVAGGRRIITSSPKLTLQYIATAFMNMYTTSYTSNHNKDVGIHVLNSSTYTVRGLGWARARRLLLALNPGPPGLGQPQLALAHCLKSVNRLQKSYISSRKH